MFVCGGEQRGRLWSLWRVPCPQPQPRRTSASSCLNCCYLLWPPSHNAKVLLTHPPTLKIYDWNGNTEVNIFSWKVQFMLRLTKHFCCCTGNSERCGWERVLWGCQDTLRLHLNHLLALVTSPRTHLQTRVRAAQALSKHARLHAIVNCTAKANPQVGRKGK